mmetsp:Transcript_17000/g.23649  ORF Transcript_17000/g.23649 Transcript_17000/m.23649 type:complete len:127 (+) Transcript_17000:459-839(+)
MYICSLRSLVARYATRVSSNLPSRSHNVLYSSQRNAPSNGRPPIGRDGKPQGNTKEQPVDYQQALNQKTGQILQKYLKESPKFDRERAQEFKAEINREVAELRKEWVTKTKEGKDPNVINVSNKRP